MAYELVQAHHHPEFRQPRMPHAIATLMSHIWHHADLPRTVEGGDIANFVGQKLRLALPAKICPDQSQAFKEVNNSQAFTVGRILFYLFFFSTSRFQVLQRMFV